MKTSSPKPAGNASIAPLSDDLGSSTKSGSPDAAFQALLHQQTASPDRSKAAATSLKAEGIAIGYLSGVDPQTREILVDIPSLQLQAVAAVSMVQLEAHHVGHAVALGFEGADAYRPIVLGLMMHGTPAQQYQTQAGQFDAAGMQITHNGHRVVVQAQSELELRCGEAVILLCEDGSIQIRGTYVTTHASASNRIRGGSVQIN
ncbi:DUF6484 domain-containing protein [Acidovorax sp. Leaf78]|uniref:DUF6484 domain-containing protein n=1 Tax=Acidovorax sp. Leaf78 TaxID=1736237 RepID=UPI000A661185|nr:DUF6484 domain-containing protein [Acidovorax sp. Leaf78]